MEIIVRATILYGLLFFLFRGTRKRALAELSPFEMILLVTLGDIVQQGITQEDYSLTGMQQFFQVYSYERTLCYFVYQL